MPSEVILPRVDMDMATGKIAKWFVEPGATVTKGQPLFEIETDKAAMEIEAPATGTIRDMAEASGSDIPVGSVVAWIFAAGEAEAQTAPAPKSEAARPREGGDPAQNAPPKAVEAAAGSPLDPRLRGDERVGAASQAGTASQARTVSQDPNRPRATPMARRLAREANLDLSAVTGTGPRGRIQAGDVTSAVTRAPAAISSTPAGPMGAAAAQATEALAAPTQAAVAHGPVAAGALNLVRLRDGEGRPTLLIHGFGADSNTWRPFLAGRSSSRPVLALDLPGHGASPGGTIRSFADLVDSVEAALLERDLGPVDLVGHSLGGGVAAALAGRGGLDLRSLLLIAPTGLGPEINGAFVRGFLSATTEASLTPWMHELVADPATISPAFVRATLKAREGTALVETQRAVAEAVFADATQTFSIRADLARLSMPVRVIVGTADKVLPARYADSLPPRVALHRLPCIGHMPQFEARDDVAAILAQMIT